MSARMSTGYHLRRRRSSNSVVKSTVAYKGLPFWSTSLSQQAEAERHVAIGVVPTVGLVPSRGVQDLDRFFPKDVGHPPAELGFEEIAQADELAVGLGAVEEDGLGGGAQERNRC